MSVEIQTRGNKASQRYLSELITNIDEDLSNAIVKLGDSIVAEARSNLQNNTNINSGTLLSSIRILDEGTNYVIIGSDVPYAGYIEYGRGPVRPINGEWLHWIDKQTGKDVFAKFAKATEPSPFLEPAVITWTSKFQDVVAELINRHPKPIGEKD
jgi:hypothetical protein